MSTLITSPADRRRFLETAAATLLLGLVCERRAWAQARPAELDAWARQLVDLKDDLRAGRIGVSDWQTAVERLNSAVPVHELTAYLDVDAITRGFTYGSSLAEARDPLLPPEIVGAAGMQRWFVRIFGLRNGGAIIPHVHNNMVSAHLVISGSFHARTHDRIQDLSDAVLLRPTRDGVIGVGDVLSMSDVRDNQHWLVALQDRSMTFDVGVVGLPASWEYGHEANRYNMIYVDPTAPAERDGSIVAPTLTWERAAAKFAV